MAGSSLVESFAFAAEHDGGGGCVLDLIVRFGAAFVEAVNPVAALLEFLERAVDVSNADDGYIGERSCGGAGDGIGEAGGATFGDDDSYCSGGVRGADDGSEVVRIFDAVEDDVQSAGGDGLFQRGEFLGGSKGDNALVGSTLRRSVERFAGFKADGDLAIAAEFNDFLEAWSACSFDDKDAVKGAAGA